jgi:protein TonB
MNFALSQRRPDRHPVGLLVVIGLHVLVAAALLSARLADRAPAPPPAALTPIPEPAPVVRQPDPLPLPRAATLPRFVAPLPQVVADPVEAPRVARVDDAPTPPATVPTFAVGPAQPMSQALRVQPRPAVINAGAAQCHPGYPPAAQRAGAEGVSRIRFTVDASGHIASAQILQSSGPTREHRLLDKAAAEALAQCPVTPGTDDMGRPVGATTDVDYVWRIE